MKRKRKEEEEEKRAEGAVLITSRHGLCSRVDLDESSIARGT